MIQGVLGGTPISERETARALSELRAPLGVWAVLGNHDRWHGAAAMRDAFEDVGVPLLENCAVPRDVAGRPRWLVRISDYDEEPRDLAAAFAAAPPQAGCSWR